MLASPATTEHEETLAANGAQDENRTHDLRITSDGASPRSCPSRSQRSRLSRNGGTVNLSAVA
jgi:hypothetical protein